VVISLRAERVSRDWALFLALFSVEGGTGSGYAMAMVILTRRILCKEPLGVLINHFTSGWDCIFFARAPNLRFVSGGGSASCRSHSAKFWGLTLVCGSENTSRCPSPSSFSLLFFSLFWVGWGRKFGKLAPAPPPTLTPRACLTTKV